MYFALRLSLHCLAASACFAAALAAHADDTACTVEGRTVIDKKTVASKDCFENISADPEDFKFVCDAMAKTALAVTRSVGTAPPVVTHGKTCPPGAVAVCKGFMFKPIANHHYHRSPKELQIARESCLSQGGEWN